MKSTGIPLSLLALFALGLLTVGCFGLPPTDGIFKQSGDAQQPDTNGPKLCTPGESRCAGSGLETCAGDGTQWIGSACSCGCELTDGRGQCIPPCTPFEKRCDGDIMACNPDGCGFSVLEKCEYDCTEKLLCQFCKPNSRTCNASGNVDSCSSDGMTLSESELCQGGCDAGQCKRCTPGAERCQPNGSIIERCSDDGSWNPFKPCQFGCNPQTGACIACKPGDRRCDSPLELAICLPDGEWKIDTCPQGCDPAKRQCRGAECKPGESRCAAGDVVERCLPDGSGWQSVQKCAPGGCLFGSCSICQGVGRQCVPGGVQLCDPDTGQSIFKPCALECNPGTLDCNACKPGVARCSTGNLESCGKDGQWQVSQICPIGCDVQLVKCRICKPGERQCSSTGNLMHCSTTGTGWNTELCNGGCDSSTLSCLDGCKTDQLRCGPSGHLERCDPNGEWAISQKCEFGCNPDILLCKVEQQCFPGSRRCSTDGHIEQCQNNASAWLVVEKCNLGCDLQTVSCKSDSACKPGITRCSNDGHVEQCLPDGGGWKLDQKCEFGCSIGPVGVPQCQASSTVISIAAGDFHSCAIRSDNTLWCWGNNQFGSLGVGDTQQHSTPVLVGKEWKQVSAGRYVTCGIQLDATLWCWGIASFFGQPPGQNVTTPRLVGKGVWISVDVGGTHACGIQQGGGLWCWGRNQVGQLGIGTTGGVFSQPKQVGPTTGNWIQVSAGMNGSCAIRRMQPNATTGPLFCWGRNLSNSLGPGPVNAIINKPTHVGTDSDSWRRVSIVFRHTCAIRSDASLWCWGANQSGQLGTKAPSVVTSPTVTDKGSWIDIRVGGTSSCGIKGGLLGSDPVGKIWCFGSNQQGQLGNPDLPATFGFGEIHGGLFWVALDSAISNSCGLTADSQMACWGAVPYLQSGGVPNVVKQPLFIKFPSN